MAQDEFRDVVTIDGQNITLLHKSSPLGDREFVGTDDALNKIDVFDPVFRPENYNKADGSPLRLFDAQSVKVDLS